MENRLHPLEIHGFEWHQNKQGVGLVFGLGVEVCGFWVEEAHGGLVPHVTLITMHWRIVQSGEERVRQTSHRQACEHFMAASHYFMCSASKSGSDYSLLLYT